MDLTTYEKFKEKIDYKIKRYSDSVKESSYILTYHCINCGEEYFNLMISSEYNDICDIVRPYIGDTKVHNCSCGEVGIMIFSGAQRFKEQDDAVS